MRSILATLGVILLLTPALAAQRPAELVACTDGDTCTFTGFGEDVRFARIDTPEMDGNCRTAAVEARGIVLWKLQNARSIQVDSVDTGSNGRIVGEVYVDGVNLSDWLLEHRFATEWPDEEPCPALAAEQRMTPRAEPTPAPSPEPQRGGYRGPYDPSGPDRDCVLAARENVPEAAVEMSHPVTLFEVAGGAFSP